MRIFSLYFFCLTAFVFLNLTVLHAQLKLGTNPVSIHKSSVLELESSNQGLLLSRIADTTLAPLTTAPDGMIIYLTADNSLRLRKAGHWQKIADGLNFWELAGAAGGDLTGTYPNPTIKPGAVTYAKIQDVSANGRLLGRYTTGAGTMQEIMLGAGLALNNTTGQLTASGLGGTVTSVGSGYGLLGGPITTTGTLLVDSATLSAYYLRRKDSTAAYVTPYFLINNYATIAGLNTKVNIADTAAMLGNYVRVQRFLDSLTAHRTTLATKVNIADTAAMLTNYVRAQRLADTSTTLRALIATKGGGTVTSVGSGYGLTGGPITTTGTLIVDSAALSSYYLRRRDSAVNYVTPYFLGSNYATLTNLAAKVNIADTAAMLSNYMRVQRFMDSLTAHRATLATKVNSSDTAAMLTNYVRAQRLADTSTSLRALIATKGGGSVTSVGSGYGLTGGPVTTTGTITADTSATALSGYYLRRKDSVVNYVTPTSLHNGYWALGGNSVSSTQNLGTTTAFDLPFITGNTEQMRLTSGGSLGIGTTAPAAKLDVRGTFKLGTNGSVLSNIIKGTYTTTAAISIPGGGGYGSPATDITFPVTNAAIGSVVSVSPTAAMPTGVSIAYAYVSSTGNVTIRLVNASMNTTTLLGILVGQPQPQTLPSGSVFNVVVTQ
ncbi:hypothetical protein [Deminuibacter soli]|uniref:Tail fiber domain-containing protein n=1 Tax=Deminuibacter soli TaxID=2291815 RepID=A0A3E1NJ98_9BACT|nr:hypothetical protein [Deminuibacter soli]RFM27858.1 hypothetical protein DXN05_14280 [Deminuibacter soli]